MTGIKILIVDDSDADACLMVRAMGSSTAVRFIRVDTREAMLNSLQQEHWDVILSDYTMPQFSGLDALGLWKEQGLDIPFIIVSGAMSDEMAVAAMRAGARDCVRKTDLARLEPVVERELREAAKNRLLTKRYVALSNVGQRLSVAMTPQEAARIITDVADEMIGWDSCFVALSEPTLERISHIFEVDVIDGKRCDVSNSTRSSTLTPMLKKVLEYGPQLISRDSSGKILFATRIFGDRNRYSASLMFVAIRKGSQVLGFLSIQSYTPHKYTPDDLVTLQNLADTCAGALKRVRAEEELRASEKRYRLLFESNPTPIFVIERSSLRFLAANEAGIGHYGYSREEFLSMAIEQIWAKTDQALFLQELERLKSEEKRFTIGRHQKRNGTVMDVEITSLPIIFSDRPARLCLVMDVTERKNLEKEILEISGREQRRIGHDLHDGLCQQLAGIGFLSQILTEDLEQKSAQESASAKKITDLIDQAVIQTRSIARGFFPVRLEENGLNSALEELAVNTGKIFSVSCRFESGSPVVIQDNVHAENLYYIAREALANAVKHGKARQISIHLKIRESRGFLIITDDGIGISISNDFQGMGLRIMNYRARMINASLEIERATPKGTRVTCIFPHVGFNH